ncbi:unnamed protein product [Phytomonas sp. EM1]|nr:unnamed protein product [Phytomonas sp. EM1]|eukprot:CCW60205.1 unnamed protein product [Phytomonas sp. isolate EM1]
MPGDSAKEGGDFVRRYAPLVMLVDGMNKEVEWQVVVGHVDDPSGKSVDAAHEGGVPSLRFSLDGVAEAVACEAAVLARLAQKKAEEIEKSNEEQANGPPAGLISSPENPVEVDASEDEGGEVKNDDGVDVVELD